MTVPRNARPGGEAEGLISDAIHDLVAARLARAFVPLAGLFAAGLVALFGSRAHGLWVAGGAVVTAAAVMFYGLAIVQAAAGRRGRLRKAIAGLCSVVPPVFGVYILGWPGLRRLASLEGMAGAGAAILYVLLGVWVLRSWLRITEVRRLAQVMIPPHEVGGDSTR